MRKFVQFISLSLAVMMLPCTFSIAFATDENEESVLAGIEYSSIAQVQGQLFFLGEYLYTYDAETDNIVKESEEPAQDLYAPMDTADFMLVNGGDELHALDTTKGGLYVLDEDGCRLVAQLPEDVFSDATDLLDERRYLMPTLAQTDNGETLYLLVSNEDRPTEFDLLYFDLSSGASGTVKIDHSICIANYQSGKMVAIIEKTDEYRIVEIDVTTNKVVDVLYEEMDPRYRITGMAYDPSTDRLIVITSKGLYRVADQTMIDIDTYLPDMEDRDISRDYSCFLNNEFIFINQSVFFTSALDEVNDSHSLRFANSGLDDTIRGFMQENPDVKVSFNDEMIWNNEKIFNSLLTNDSDVDIITLYAGSGLTAIKNKSYYVDLSGSQELTEDVCQMYPQIREILMDGDKLIAYPREMMVFCWLENSGALQQKGYDIDTATMEDWITFVEEEADDFDIDQSTSSIFPQGFTRRQLIDDILIQYIVEYESYGQLDFDNAELKDILKRALKLPSAIFLKDDSEGTSIDAYDTGLPPLFDVNTLLSPDAYVGFYEQYGPKYVAPPAFSIAPMVRATLSVYLVNPYSKNQETAIKFIEYYARHADPTLNFYIDQNYDQAIPDQEYVDLEEQTTGTIEDLTNSLDQAAPEDRAQIETEIEGQKIILEYAQKNEWLVSDEDIAAYQQMVPNITFLPDSLCFTDSSYSVTNIDLYEMIDRLLAKNIDLDEFLTTLEHKYSMISKEKD